MEHPDDAAIFVSPSGDKLIQTLDLIAPIVNDARDFGRVAAANSISDVYAMGGRPLTAMNIMCFPTTRLPLSLLGDILAGANEKIDEAGALLIGGHTVTDPELKFGLSLTGVVEGGDIWSIDRARVGDVLLLTKPIGTGVVNAAIRKDGLSDDSPEVRAALRSMTLMNAAAMRAGRAGRASSCTDITGFGLLGHCAQFARASQVSFEVQAAAVPLLPGVQELVARGILAGRSVDNADAYRERVLGVRDDQMAALLFDPQTSGGLLLTVPEESVELVVAALAGEPFPATPIGRVTARQQHDVIVR